MFRWIQLVFLMTALGMECNPSLCSSSWQGDMHCDSYCMTPYCNFDAPLEVDGLTEKFSSDCYLMCVINLGCNEYKLGNGICDSDCNFAECGFDWGDCGYCAIDCFEAMLESDSCEPACDSPECLYSLGNCSECAPGCTNSLLSNSECDEVCNSLACNYDNGHCAMGLNRCVQDCMDYMIDNGECNEECFFEVCEYDGGDCLCNPWCFDSYLGDGKCDEVCNVEACGFDGGDCGECASGCFWEMVGDGECQEACFNEECGWDSMECGCSSGCLWSDLGSCKLGCLVPSCYYDEYPDYPACNDSLITNFALFTQLSMKDFSLEVTFDFCEEQLGCQAEDYGSTMTECWEECNIPQCGYGLGTCYEGECTERCDFCFGNEADECLQCSTGDLFYTTCVDSCPPGFFSHQFTKLTSPVCLPVPDVSNRASPGELYVTNRLDGQVGTGTEQDPFRSIAEALASVYMQHVEIFLIGEGPYELNGLPDDSPYLISLQDRHDPLSRADLDIQYLALKPLSGTATLSVVSSSDYMRISVANEVDISNLKIEGGSVNKNCTGSEYCDYCPNLVQDTNGYRTDRGGIIQASEYFTGCKEFHHINLFVVNEGAQLKISNTTFENLRMELNSLIYSKGGSVDLQSVHFRNIKVYGAVVYYEDCGNGYDCGQFSFSEGTVSLLNNGFEYSTGLEFPGFFFSESTFELSLDSVLFSKNIVYSMNGGSLIRLKVFYALSIANCEFISNFSRDGVVLADATALSYNYSLNSAGEIEQLLINHVQVVSTRLLDNYFVNSGLFYGEYNNELHNFYFGDLYLAGNVLETNSMITVINSIVKPEYLDTIDMPVEINGSRMTATFTKRSLEFSDFRVFNNSLGGIVLCNLNNIVNLELNGLLVQSNSPEEDAFNRIFLPKFKEFGEEGYLSLEVVPTPAYDCWFLMIIGGCFNLVILDSTVSENSCFTSTPVSIISYQDGLHLKNSTFSYNSGMSIYSGVLYLDGGTDLYIENCEFSYNSNAIGPSVLSTSIDGGQKIYISDSIFTANTENSVLFVVAAVFHLTNCVFQDNTNLMLKGGAILYGSPGSDGLSFVIENTTFLRNQALAASGGAIVITDYSNGEKSLVLHISNSSFIENYAATSGSAIVIESNVYIDSSSSIADSAVVGNTVGVKGTFAFFHSKGDLTLTNLTVSDNSIESQSGEGAFIYSTMGGNSILYMEYSSVHANRGKNIVAIDESSVFNFLSTRDCEFSNNTGNSITINYGQWEDTQSKFCDNFAYFGGAILSESSAKLQLMGTMFIRNSGFNGGAAILRSESYMNCTSCWFEQNTAENMGGGIFLEQNSEIEVISTTFTGNVAEKGSAVASLGCESSTSLIRFSEIEDNTALIEGTIYLMLSSFSIESSEMKSNSAASGTPGICAILSRCSLENSTFDSQHGVIGTYLYISTTSEAYIRNCEFSNAVSTGSGGAIFGIASTLDITNSSFKNISAVIGGAIYSYSESEVYIADCEFDNVTAEISGGVLDAYEIELRIKRSSFRNIGMGAMDLQKMLVLEVTDCQFSSLAAPAIQCFECEAIIIQKSEFDDISGDNEGAVYLHTNVYSPQVQVVDQCSFNRNSARLGAAINSEGHSLAITSCVFADNTAVAFSYSPDTDIISEGIGGAVLYKCPLEDCTFTISHSDFTKNSAAYNGGAISWENIEPNVSDCSFFENQADYGPNFASFPVKLMQATAQEGVSRILESKTRALTTIAPGQSTSIAVALLDHYDQVVTTNNLASVSLLAEAEVSLSGMTKVTTSRGIANFTDFTISYMPGSTVDLLIETDGIVKASDNPTSITITVELRDCILGEAMVGIDCFKCEAGTYSLNPQDTECTACPAEGVCYGGYEMVPTSGYWRSSKYSAVLWPCPNPDACEGGEINEDGEVSYTGRCSEGYRGNMCQACESGFSVISNNRCGKCPKLADNILKLIGVGTLIAIVLVFTIQTTIRSAYTPKALHAVYIKVFINYLQLVMVTASFNLKWPELVLEMFSVHNAAGSVTEHALSFDCFIEGEVENAEMVYYYKLMGMGLMPALLAVLCLIVWTFICCWRECWSYMKDEFVATLVVLLFLVHPNLVKVMFSSMNCTEIESGEYWLKENLDIECGTSTHLNFVFLVAVPSLIIWGIGAPTFCLGVLIRHRKRLNKLSIRKKFGFLFNGYTTRGFYWEFVILYRKILIISCLVFLGNISVGVQALTGTLLLIVSLCLQKFFQPYRETALNTMETRSILVSSITIFCGLYYLTDSLDEVGEILFFVVIILVNLYFLYHWGTAFFGAGMQWLSKKIPFIRRRLFRKIHNTYTHIFKLEERELHVVGRENEKYYTLCGALELVESPVKKQLRPASYPIEHLFLSMLKAQHQQRTQSRDNPKQLLKCVSLK